MDFLKKHYEKILLGIVLVGLAVAFVFLPFKIADEKQKLQDLEQGLKNPRIKPLTNLDLTFADNTLKRVTTPLALDLSTTNRLVNPIPWQQGRDSRLYRVDRTGPAAVVVTNITPLYLSITLDDIKPGDPNDAAAPTRYMISVEKQAATKLDQRKKRPYFVKVGEKNENFQLKEVTGPAESPSVVLLLNDGGETINVSKEKPYRRVDGYMASLYYEPQKKKMPDQRVGQTININGEDYKIVAISKDEVVLSAPNQKKWPVKLSNPPS